MEGELSCYTIMGGRMVMLQEVVFNGGSMVMLQRRSV